MAERRQVPIMSVKLAIQRELAYRKKVASFLSDADAAELLKGLLPLQVPSSSKRSAPDQNLRDQFRPSSFPSASHQELSLTPNPWPERGPISGPSVVPLNQVSPSAPISQPLLGPSQVRGTISSSKPAPMPTSTYSGTKGKLTASSLHCLPPQQYVPSHSININKLSPGNYFCKVCQVSCSGWFNYKQHLRGHKHRQRANQKLLKGSRHGVGENESQQSRCGLCHIWCIDENSLSLHFKGQKHRAKVQESELGQENVERKSAKQLWCELCQVPCTNEETFVLHLKGKNHAARAYAAEMEKKAEFEETAMT